MAAVLAVWYVLSANQIISPTRFPAPREVWESLRQIALAGYADARLHAHILHSVKLVLMGFAVAVATGVPLGLAMGWIAVVHRGQGVSKTTARWLAGLAAALVAVSLARVLPGRPGYWLDLGLIMFALYLAGCAVGSWLRDRALSRHRA